MKRSSLKCGKWDNLRAGTPITMADCCHPAVAGRTPENMIAFQATDCKNLKDDNCKVLWITLQFSTDRDTLRVKIQKPVIWGDYEVSRHMVTRETHGLLSVLRFQSWLRDRGHSQCHHFLMHRFPVDSSRQSEAPSMKASAARHWSLRPEESYNPAMHGEYRWSRTAMGHIGYFSNDDVDGISICAGNMKIWYIVNVGNQRHAAAGGSMVSSHALFITAWFIRSGMMDRSQVYWAKGAPFQAQHPLLLKP